MEVAAVLYFLRNGVKLHFYSLGTIFQENIWGVQRGGNPMALGFQVEHNGPKNIADETDSSAYDNETHLLKVLDVILNKSYHKLRVRQTKQLLTS